MNSRSVRKSGGTTVLEESKEDSAMLIGESAATRTLIRALVRGLAPMCISEVMVHSPGHG